MFTTQTIYDVTQLWEQLGTFYSRLDPESKARIESYWKALYDGVEALYYSSAQHILAGSIYYSPGYIEHTFDEILIIRDSLITDYLTPPGNVQVESGALGDTNYYYRVTSVNSNGETEVSNIGSVISGHIDLTTYPNTVTWNEVPGASSYNIYGRDQYQYYYIDSVATASFTDTGAPVNSGITAPVDVDVVNYYNYPIGDSNFYVTIPTLSGVFSGNTLYENVDYIITNLDTISFLNSGILPNREIFYTERAASLIPIIPNLFFQSLGSERDVKKPLNNYSYKAYYDGWRTADYTDQRVQWTTHLGKWCNAVYIRMASGPTVKNLKETLELLFNVPFAYESGTVSAVTNSGGYNYFSIGDTNYEIPDTLTLIVSEGDTVAQFEMLCDGVTVTDYVIDASLLQSIVSSTPTSFGVEFVEPEYFSIAFDINSELYNLNYDNDFIGFFFTSVVPPHQLSWIKYDGNWLNLCDYLSILKYSYDRCQENLNG